ncbi:MAG: amidase [Planctomycetaceae bacterium]|nr:amidase [Planctomycetaceae bacterium]
MINPASLVEKNLRSAVKAAEMIRHGETTSLTLTQQCIDRIKEVDPQINAVVIPLFEQALEAARRLDELAEQGKYLGPLHGVPVTVKECFFVADTDCCLGVDGLTNRQSEEDGIMVQRLKDAGAVVLGKTNIPQMMLWHECVNPVYGRTLNPWNLERTPGGSSGGEAAILAAGGSYLGLGNDLGGSLRVPAHFTGIFSLKPTNGLLTRRGSRGNFRGMEAMLAQPGPMGHCVADLECMLKVMIGELKEVNSLEQSPVALQEIPDSVAGMRIGIVEDDGFFKPSPGIQRSIREAADYLETQGAIVETFEIPAAEMMFRLYVAAMSADGGFQARYVLRGSRLHSSFRKLILATRIPGWFRSTIAGLLKLCGQNYQAVMVGAGRGLSAKHYWLLIDAINQYRRKFIRAFEKQKLDVILSPCFALPAMCHDDGIDLLPAGSHAMLQNLVGGPGGMIPWSVVQDDEESDRETSRDGVVKKAISTETDSAGLPLGVQVSGLPWQEHRVLAVMRELERGIPG